MASLCGADCGACPFRADCRGCSETCGHPRGGDCLAARCILEKGCEGFEALKRQIMEELNELHVAGMPPVTALYCLSGSFVNLAYPTPGGETVRFLKDEDVYLGTQLPAPEEGRCFGAVAGPDFLLVAGYGAGGSDPQLMCFRQRQGK